MNFGEVLLKAWQIIWKHKVLWIFGILAGCANGGGSNLTYTLNGSDYGKWSTNLPPSIENYFSDFSHAIPWIILGIIVTLVLVVLAIFLVTIGRIGLVRGVLKADGGPNQAIKDIKLTFGELFSGSIPYFWRVFGLNLVVGLLIAAVIVLTVLALIFGSILTLGLGLICLFPFICLMIPAGWVIGLVVEQANNAIIIENLGIIDGLSRGWDVFRKNLGNILGMGLILLVIGFAAALLIGLPLLLVSVPLFFGLMRSGFQEFYWNSLWISLVCLCIYLPFLLVLSGMLSAYLKSVWTLTFLRLTVPPAPVEIIPPASEPPAEPEIVAPIDFTPDESESASEPPIESLVPEENTPTDSEPPAEPPAPVEIV
jgi:hypothetical protein